MRRSAALRIRAGSLADLEMMYRLDVLCFAEPFRFSRPAMRRFATRANAGVFVAESRGELAGFVIVHVEREKGRMVGYIVTLDVRPEMRRQGLAGRLMEAAERHAADAGAERMLLHVYVGNQDAVSFYERTGYEKVGDEADFYGPKLDGRLYGKGLRGQTAEA